MSHANPRTTESRGVKMSFLGFDFSVLHVHVSITFAADPANPSPSLGAPVGFSLGVSGACVGFCGVAGLASPRMLRLGWGGTERGPGDIQDGSDVGPLAGSSGSSVARATPVLASDLRGSGSGLRFFVVLGLPWLGI